MLSRLQFGKFHLRFNCIVQLFIYAVALRMHSTKTKLSHLDVNLEKYYIYIIPPYYVVSNVLTLYLFKISNQLTYVDITVVLKIQTYKQIKITIFFLFFCIKRFFFYGFGVNICLCDKQTSISKKKKNVAIAFYFFSIISSCWTLLTPLNWPLN